MNTKIRNVTCIVSLMAGLAIMPMTSNAALYYETSGSFTNVMPSGSVHTVSNTTVNDAGVVGTGSIAVSNLTWGTPLTPANTQSELTFTGFEVNSALPPSGTTLDFGIITFHNGTLGDTDPSNQVELNLQSIECDPDVPTGLMLPGACDDPNASATPPGGYQINIFNTDNVGTAAQNADGFCLVLDPGPPVVEICAWAYEENDVLQAGTSGGLSGGAYTDSISSTNDFLVRAHLSTIVIVEVVPLTVGAFVTLGTDPTRNIIALAVPEPGVVAMMGLGLLMLGVARRGRKS